MATLLGGCVPLSVSDWSGGSDAELADPTGESADGGGIDAGAFNDAGARDARVDARVAERDAGAREGDGNVPDATAVEAVVDAAMADAAMADAAVADAAVADAGVVVDAGPVSFCKSTDALCDDFEGATLVCPSVQPRPWSSCERLGTAPDAVVLEGPPPRKHGLFSSMGSGPGERSARVAFDLPAEFASFHSEFDFLLQGNANPLYTFVKLEQQAGVDEDGVATHYVGVSLIVRDGFLALSVQTANDLSKPSAEVVVNLQPAPSAWTRVAMDVVFAEQILVTLQFDGGERVTFQPFARGSVTIEAVQFLLGAYTDDLGAAMVTYDNVSLRYQ